MGIGATKSYGRTKVMAGGGGKRGKAGDFKLERGVYSHTIAWSTKPRRPKQETQQGYVKPIIAGRTEYRPKLQRNDS
jgi:hypothetical protein